MTYTLTINEKQAAVISTAVEVLARLGIGQFRPALEHLPTREFIPPGWHEDMETIGQILRKHLISDSLGIHNDRAKHDAKVAWDLYQVVRQRLAWDYAVKKGIVPSIDTPRKWPEMMAVCYDTSMQTSAEPLAKMKKP